MIRKQQECGGNKGPFVVPSPGSEGRDSDVEFLSVSMCPMTLLSERFFV